jgi:hypothetical protein
MANLLQKVFLIFVRPYYEDDAVADRKVFIKTDIRFYDNGTYRLLKTINPSGRTTSPDVLNSSSKYDADAWFLYGSYTSYNDMKETLKNVIAVYGTANVRPCVYIPIDYEVLPNK